MNLQTLPLQLSTSDIQAVNTKIFTLTIDQISTYFCFIQLQASLYMIMDATTASTESQCFSSVFVFM